jgi:hypothetical protein
MRKPAKSDYLIKRTLKPSFVDVSPMQHLSTDLSERLLFIDESVIQGMKEKLSTYSDLRFFEPKLSSRGTLPEFGHTSEYSKTFNDYVAAFEIVHEASEVDQPSTADQRR